MIAYLEGTVISRLDKQIIVLTSGVGYLVYVGNDIISTAEEQKPIRLFIHTQVKEDDLSLFGFKELSELKFFQQLISVSGIGAKTAMGILDMPIHLTQQAVHQEDTDYLCQVPGLGKKTAARLVLELKGKIELSIHAEHTSNSLPRSLQEEVLEALQSLGYDKPSVIRFLNSTDQSYDTAEEMVRAFLQRA